MGLFGGSDTDEEAETLAVNARGDSVEAEQLARTEAGLGQSHYLDNRSIKSLLHPDEQPHHLFFNVTKGITRDGVTVGDSDNSYQSACVVTDSRVLLLDGSMGEAIPLSAITETETSAGHMKNRLTFKTPAHEYTFYISGGLSGGEVHDCGEYMEARGSQEASDKSGEPVGPVEGLNAIWEGKDHLEGASSPDVALAAEPQGKYVTKSRYEKIAGILDPEEKLHFLTRGSTVDVEGSGAGNSLFGDDRSRKSGTRGWVRAAITDKRIAIKIPQILGTDERSVPYSSVTSVDLDTGLVKKRLTLQTAGQTYHIEVDDPGKDETRRAVRFIREKINEANQPDVVQQPSDTSESDPLEKIEKLKELRDAGAITEEEFDEKKQDLLDEV